MRNQTGKGRGGDPGVEEEMDGGQKEGMDGEKAGVSGILQAGGF